MESVGLAISTGFSPVLDLPAGEAHEERTDVAKSKFPVPGPRRDQSAVVVCRSNKYSLFTTCTATKRKTAVRNVWHWRSSRRGGAETGVCS